MQQGVAWMLQTSPIFWLVSRGSRPDRGDLSREGLAASSLLATPRSVTGFRPLSYPPVCHKRGLVFRLDVPRLGAVP
jgi:hypothetical protein